MAVAGENLAPFVSRLAAEWMASWPEERHRQLEGTLVSADLSGFTAMSERLAAKGKQGAEELTESINGCFTGLIAAAAVDGGDVLKFGGDAVLLWFDGDDHVVRAVRAAARMQLAIGGARHRRKGLAMSVGIHTGAFDMFLVGRTDWRELVLAGRAVSATVDLESAAASGEVLVSSAVAERLPFEWTVTAAGGAQLVLDAPGATLGRKRVSPPMVDHQVARRLVDPTLQANVAALAGTSGEHRLATIVFGELEGTDRSVADLGPGFADSVHALVQATQDGAERYGLLFLYTDVIADGIKLIVVAGAPVSTGEDEEAGLRFATELVGGDPKRKLRAGVNRGRIFAGFLGSPARRAYTVMGDPVNLAARLMGRAKPGEVYGSDDVVRASRAEFALRSVAPFLVKGRTQPVSAHVVGSPTGAHRLRGAGNELPLVGREPELAELRDAIASAAGGFGQVVEIVGDAGIGKTRLLQAIADDPRVLVRVATECQPYDALSPFAGVRPLLRRALGVADDATPALAGRQLTTTAQRVAPSVMPMLPLVAVAIGAEVEPTPEASAIAEEFLQTRMHEAVLDLLKGALPSTTMLTVEDVYYVDDASLQLLRALARVVAGRPWLLAVTRRPEGPGVIVRDVDGLLVKLSPLPDDHAARLAGLAVGERAVGAVDLHALVQRSGGNPLFVLELVDAAGAGVAEDDLPESIERVVATRVDRLAPDDRALLRQAAVAGRVFHSGLVNTLFAAEGRSTVGAEQWGRLAEFVEPAGDRRWRFRHALFRDVAYEGLPFARRKRLHRAVGELIEAGVAGEPDPALLSLHFWLAGDAERTWRYSVAAGDAAWRSFAVSEAIATYRRALDVRRRLKLLDRAALAAVAETLGDALERSARYDEAGDAFALSRRAAPAPRDPATDARLVRKLGELKERTGEYRSAVTFYRRAAKALPSAPQSEDLVELAEIHLALSGVRHRQGRHRESAAEAHAALAAADRASSARQAAHARSLLVVAATYGAATDAATHGEKALQLFEAAGDALYSAKLLTNLGVLAYFEGDWRAAADLYQRSAEQYTAAGDISGRAMTENNLAELLSDQGHYEAAAAALDRATQTWTAARFAIGIALATGNRGRLFVRTGRIDEGTRYLEEALDRFSELGASSFVSEMRARLIEVDVLRGASRHLEPVIDSLLAESTEMYPATKACVLRLRGLGRMQRADWDGARVALDEALAFSEQTGTGYETALTLRALAIVAGQLGDPHAPGYEAEADRLIDRMGIVALPEVPLPI